MVKSNKKQREISQAQTLLRELSGSPMKRVVRRRQQRIPRGPYTASFPLQAPTAGSAIVRRGENVPQITQKGNTTTICNTEQLATVVTAAAGAFATARAVLLPGNFQWLSGVASSFSKWRWRYLRLIYIPTCPATTTGQVAMGLGYSHLDLPPISMLQATAVHESTTGPVWAGYEGSTLLNQFGKPAGQGAVVTELDINRLGGAMGTAWYRYITTTIFGPLPNTEKDIYSPGYVDISSAGGLAGQVGVVYVEYCIDLIEPTIAVLNA